MKQHNPGFKKLVQDAKTRIQEIELDNYSTKKWVTTYEQGKKKGESPKKNGLLIGKCLID